MYVRTDTETRFFVLPSLRWSLTQSHSLGPIKGKVQSFRIRSWKLEISIQTLCSRPAAIRRHTPKPNFWSSS